MKNKTYFKMKKAPFGWLFSILMFSFLLTQSNVKAQSTSFGPAVFLDTAAVGARGMCTADLDRDGDMDVILAQRGPSMWIDTSITESTADSIDLGHRVGWYENLGDGNFGAQQKIGSILGGYTIYAPDLDGDGDADILVASAFDNTVNWFENRLNTSGGFGPRQIIADSAQEARGVFAIDLDGDEDLDVISCSSADNKIAWYENKSPGVFGPERIISTNTNYPYAICADDIDGDGDADVVSASVHDFMIAWYPNRLNETGDFGPQQVISVEAKGANDVHTADFDGDGDIDVTSASRSDWKIAWYENLGGGVFGPQIVLTDSAWGAAGLWVDDLDNDDDIDIMAASMWDGEVVWFENDGSGIFSPAYLIYTTYLNGAREVFSDDLDGDGDAEVLAVSYEESHFLYCENLLPCKTDKPPAELGSSIKPNGDILLSWKPIPETIGCHVKSLIPGIGQEELFVMGGSPKEATVKKELLTPGSLFEWKVRCACSLSPVTQVTGFSEVDTIYVPELRKQNTLENKAIQHYPNPCFDEISFVIPGEISDQVRLKIYNLRGQLIFQKDVRQSLVRIDVENIPGGVYFYEVLIGNTAENRYSGKFIKQ